MRKKFSNQYSENIPLLVFDGGGICFILGLIIGTIMGSLVVIAVGATFMALGFVISEIIHWREK